MADGTNAMFIGLKALDIEPDDEIIISSHTYVATAAAIHLLVLYPFLQILMKTTYFLQ